MTNDQQQAVAALKAEYARVTPGALRMMYEDLIDRAAEIFEGSHVGSYDEVERVARAIDKAELGYSIRLTRLVDDESSYTLTYDGAEPMEFESHHSASEYVSAHRRERNARAAIAAMSPVAAPTQEEVRERVFAIAHRHTSHTVAGWLVDALSCANLLAGPVVVSRTELMQIWAQFSNFDEMAEAWRRVLGPRIQIEGE